MKYLFDTASLDLIKKYANNLPIYGITTNPSILKKEGSFDFFNHFQEIKNIIGDSKTLHIQVTTDTCDEMIQEANAICDKLGKKTYIKIPVTFEGLKAISQLKKDDYNITATAIYSKTQGLLAMESGADYIAPYYNRMHNLDIDSNKTILTFANVISNYNYKTKILAASFKNIHQVNCAIECGAHEVTLSPDILLEAFKMPSINKAIIDFRKDWVSIFGDTSIDKI